jgi:hypothetical protein
MPFAGLASSEAFDDVKESEMVQSLRVCLSTGFIREPEAQADWSSEANESGKSRIMVHSGGWTIMWKGERWWMEA